MLTQTNLIIVALITVAFIVACSIIRKLIATVILVGAYFIVMYAIHSNIIGNFVRWLHAYFMF